MDKFTLRGIIYSTIGIAGISYELTFRSSPELLVILLYFSLIVMGMIAIFYLKERKK